MTYYSRKSPRIPDYDYSRENYYFITICTHKRRCIFGKPGQPNRIGIAVQKQIELISSHYDSVQVDKYVIMPNHIHMIMVLERSGKENVQQIVAQFKSGVTREVRNHIPEIQIWQRSFHDHVIRNQAGYEKIWSYIDSNPLLWEKDCFYMDEKIRTTQ